MDTPNDTWAEYWSIGLKPNEEKTLSLEILETIQIHEAVNAIAMQSIWTVPVEKGRPLKSR